MKSIVFFLGLVLASTGVFGQKWYDQQCEIEDEVSEAEYESTNERNILTVIIDQDNNLIINEKERNDLSEIKFKELVYTFLNNPNSDKDKAESPKKAIIALASYGEKDRYEMVLNYIREVYLYAWDLKSKEEYDENYIKLNCKKRSKIISKNYPYRVLELKSEEDKKNTPSPSPGVPPFKGDVKDY
ncbi:hypothetical protein [Psychroflexus aestuariivivens]|uniref:hypothetical protein n=1 Tax=Psychroflexus aestuariivivens TaxID=1795040 RepID=UPI000FD8A269|nr:hypothetical protein [Psychroflexus aestuariivivens]